MGNLRMPLQTARLHITAKDGHDAANPLPPPFGLASRSSCVECASFRGRRVAAFLSRHGAFSLLLMTHNRAVCGIAASNTWDIGGHIHHAAKVLRGHYTTRYRLSGSASTGAISKPHRLWSIARPRMVCKGPGTTKNSPFGTSCALGARQGRFSAHCRRQGEAASLLMALLWQGNPALVKASKIKGLWVSVAEGQGFEPWGVLAPLVFKTSALDHSATPPGDA